MGNVWKGTSDEKLYETEWNMLKFTGIPPEDFELQNVVIDDDGNFARTIQVGDRSKEKIVLFHGYGGSGIIFYKIIAPLAEMYHVILVDIIGMGASSRPTFDVTNADEADEYFVNFIEKWRLAFGDLKDFFLAGHSFGGYICGHYASKYP